MSSALLHTDLGNLPLLARGKVRDIYTLGTEPGADLLFVATDRISAFDQVLGTGIPDKGKILTQLSLFWFNLLASTTKNHLLTANVAQFPSSLLPFRQQLAGRSMVVRRARMFPVECVARGYLSGSGWKDYQQTGAVCGIPLPAGLRESDRLPEPIFTPAAKNNVGHDENISFDVMIGVIGSVYAEALRSLTLAIYTRASEYAATQRLILADTKFEFGLVDKQPRQSHDEEGRPDDRQDTDDTSAIPQIVLADEVLTPDSSRYWPEATWSPGGPQPSFDKQYVRDYLESIHWNKQAPGPSLPDEVVVRTRDKYLEAFRLLTGRTTLDDPEGADA